MKHFFNKKPVNNQISQPRTRRSYDGPSELPAFSYNAKRDAKQEGIIRNREVEGDNKANPNPRFFGTKFKRRAVLIVLAGLFILFLSFIYVSSKPKIVIIQPVGFTYLPRGMNQYLKAAEQDLNSSIYNRSKLTLSSASIADSLMKKFPEIQYAGVSLSLLSSTPTIYIQFTKPVILYQSPRGEFVLNDNGDIIDYSSDFNTSELYQLPFVESSSNNSVNIGTQVLAGNTVSFIQTVQAALKAKNVLVSKYVLVPNAEEMDAYISNVNYYVVFNLNETDALQQTGTYLAAIANLKAQGVMPTQYIDVRVDGRAYYK